MLDELSIENFAIIDRLLLRFSSGFTVLTGETGAGKSIIIDALQAVLGARVAADFVRTGAQVATIEAIFSGDVLSEPGLTEFLQEEGIESDESLILRREINASGRSTARVNGRAVPLGTLQKVGSLLVDIHGQSDHLSILRRDRQLEVLDRFGNLGELRQRASASVRRYQSLARALDDLASGRSEAERKLDLLRFQVQEIEAADLEPGEDEELAAERNLLVNAEKLSQLAEAAYLGLHGEAGGALDSVTEAAAATREIAAIDGKLSGLHERLQAAQYELEDLAQELRRYRDAVEFDPRRLDEVEERLDVLTRLSRKYGPGLEEVISFGARAREEIGQIESFDERIEALQREQAQAAREAAALAAELSAGRSAAAVELESAMSRALQGLGLKSTGFRVEVSQQEASGGLEMPDGRSLSVSTAGVDDVSFLVSFNPGEPARPIERVASGGETSRFLLALKAVLAKADRTPTLVFDEIDVGIGGRHGRVVGERLRELAAEHQVFTITHMPQIAVLADEHLAVAKSVDDGHTTVGVKALERADRVREIAEMLSGTGTAAAQRNARELLESAQRSR